MPGPLEGIKVVEIGFWVAGPATAGILADWGAEVVKIEPPPAGDPFRGIFLSAVGIDAPFNPPFELDNRGKRSVLIDLRTEEGRELARRLVDRADVFVSNLRPGALERMDLDYPTLAARNPGLVYCSVTGYGVVGPDRDRAAYDVGAFWSRGGVAAMLTPPGAEPPVQRGGMGDHTTAIAAAGAVSAALVARQRTARGQHVVASLLRTGLYVVGWDVATRLRYGYVAPASTRTASPNAIVNSYRAGDGKWFWLIGLEADRHWPDVCRAIARPDLVTDPRTSNIVVRRENGPAVVAMLDEEFARRPLAEWAEIFDREGVWWAPVQDCDDIAGDPQVRAAGAVVPFDVERGLPEQLATPVDFAGTPAEPGRTAPEVGQHTEEVLLELGHTWDDIAALKERGVIP
ncbi:MAG TPA: CoA transferase [Candidatus Binatia bacterium]|nr:CoA transferase [Candidatus Binatia bacterium]